MTSKDIREKYIKFFTSRGHKEIAPAPLVPENDPTTLFTSSGMQQLVPYLLGESHPSGKRLIDSQPSFRAEDIEEVGDNRHTTFFEMLGNWSLGDYWKNEQLSWFFEFLTDLENGLGIDPRRLYVSVFAGGNGIPRDTESAEIWTRLFEGAGIKPAGRIFYFGASENWWSRAGVPENMPALEPGGPDSEVFFDFHPSNGLIGNDLKVYSRSGRLLEIGNSVFMQFQKQSDGTFKELPKKNVDFGGGLERLTAAANDSPDIFQTDLYQPITDAIVQLIGIGYEGDNRPSMRIIADHLKAATFMIINGIGPSNKLQGYILRRLLRRSAVKFRLLSPNTSPAILVKIIPVVLTIYDGLFGIDKDKQMWMVEKIIQDEINRFSKTLDHGLRIVRKIDHIDGKIAFDLYQTFGFPIEVTEEIFREKGQQIDRAQFKTEFEKHRQLSRTASAGIFKGGLADHSEIVTKYHTATHLLHQALRDVLGPDVFQQGSNITSERLRFDFSFGRKMTAEETKATEDIINKRIEEDLKVDHMIIPLDAAKQKNAIGLFDEKYSTEVSVYGIGPNYKLDPQALDQRERGGYYSLEFCGGPHVSHTKVIGAVEITKEEAVSAGTRRIRAEIVLR